MAVKSWNRPSPLLVFAKSGFTGGSGWAPVLRDSIRIFNDLVSKNGVKVALSEAKEEGDAQIIVDAVAKQASFEYRGASYSSAFAGDGLHGLTVPVSDDTGLRDRAYVFLPATPRIDPPNKKSREVRPDVRRFILVHEFIHAAGLSNAEHTLEDVFCYPGELVEGDSAASDKLQPWGGLGKPMPPYTLIAKTITNLKKAWP